MMAVKRFFRIYLIIGKTFNIWFSTIPVAIMILLLRIIIAIGMLVDKFLFWSLKRPLKNPIIIVGNPRSGTTFLHRFLIHHNVGVGSELWQLLYPSITIQKFIKPLLPYLERMSPAKYHSTEAHKTSLDSVETDDVSLLFRYLDGFFLYGFFLTFDEEDLFKWVDPKIRDTSSRDFRWLQEMWSRNTISNRSDRYIGKLFSLSSNLPAFQKFFPDSKILYLIRDPLSVIPSGLSLVTGVLDKRFNFWSLKKEIRDRFILRLYKALVELLNRFHDDWVKGKIEKEKVMIIKYDLMMSDFELVMREIITFTETENNDELTAAIKKIIMDAIKNDTKAEATYTLDLVRKKYGVGPLALAAKANNIADLKAWIKFRVLCDPDRQTSIYSVLHSVETLLHSVRTRVMTVYLLCQLCGNSVNTLLDDFPETRV